MHEDMCIFHGEYACISTGVVSTMHVQVLFMTEGEIGVLYVSSIFNAGGSLCGCRCVCTRAHTHTAHMGCLDVSPGVGMRHLEDPKYPNGLNFGIYVFVYVYKVHMYMYMLGGEMRSWTNCFQSFFFNIFFLSK